MQGLLNCGKVNLLLGCLEVALEDVLLSAGQSPSMLGSLVTLRTSAHICCPVAGLDSVSLEDAAVQIQRVLALSSHLSKLVSGPSSKAAPTDENQV